MSLLQKIFGKKEIPDIAVDFSVFNAIVISREHNKTCVLIDVETGDFLTINCSVKQHNELVSKFKALKNL